MTRGRLGLGLALAPLTLALDQASKAWILHGLELPQKGVVPVVPPLLDLVMVYNHGVTFGLFQAGSRAGQVALIAVALAVVGVLSVWLRRAESLLVAGAIGAIAGGALGNVLDRLRLGMVVDFLHLHWGAWDPFPFIFNVGDCAIVVGVSLLLAEPLLAPRPKPGG